MEKNEYAIIVFNDENLSLEVRIDNSKETVWLTQKEISELFEKSQSTINEHINNIYKEKELNQEETLRKFGNSEKSTKPTNYYNLDVIISVGYRVKSNRGIAFRRWANNVLKQYLLEGYAVNQKRLELLEKQFNLVSIATRPDENLISDEGDKIFKAILDYNKALSLLDDYDHQCLTRPDGRIGCYRISYEECRLVIDSMKFDSNLFGVEKDESFNSSINAIYQSMFGEDLYKTNEEKAANLLYFITKNHSFYDGNKRIAASIFLYFLDKNNMLYKDNKKVIDDATLVAITILIAESKPEEKEIIISLVMSFLRMDYIK